MAAKIPCTKSLSNINTTITIITIGTNAFKDDVALQFSCILMLTMVVSFFFKFNRPSLIYPVV